MKILLEMFGLAMLSLFAENLVFTGGFSSCQLIRATSKRRPVYVLAVCIAFFQFLATLVIWPLDHFLGYEKWAAYIRPFTFTVVIVLLYLALLLIIKFLDPRAFQAYYKLFIKAAFNCVVLGVPLLISGRAYTLLQSIGYSIGAGAGFLLATWFVAEGMRTLNNPDMPKCFRGFPAMLIYIGILSLAFFGFSGRSIYY